jgi:succinate dehydrogenase / fumarate reductase, iron-sulfur subunit
VPAPAAADQPERPDDRLPVSEVAFDRPGSPSPFGEDVTFPLPAERLHYRHA